MPLRAYRDADAAATRGVFQRAVRVTAARDYSPEQVTAWAPADADPAAWAHARAAADTVVAVDGEEVVGFGDLVDRTRLDMLYVDPAAGSRGIGSALIDCLVARARDAGARAVVTDASLTARPVFERHGFVVTARRTPVVRGVAMTNFAMRRALAATPVVRGR